MFHLSNRNKLLENQNCNVFYKLIIWKRPHNYGFSRSQIRAGLGFRLRHAAENVNKNNNKEKLIWKKFFSRYQMSSNRGDKPQLIINEKPQFLSQLLRFGSLTNRCHFGRRKLSRHVSKRRAFWRRRQHRNFAPPWEKQKTAVAVDEWHGKLKIDQNMKIRTPWQNWNTLDFGETFSNLWNEGTFSAVWFIWIDKIWLDNVLQWCAYNFNF